MHVGFSRSFSTRKAANCFSTATVCSPQRHSSCWHLVTAGRGDLETSSRKLWPATFVVEKNLANLVSEIRAIAMIPPIRVHSDGASVWVRVSRNGPRPGAAGASRRVAFGIKWMPASTLVGRARSRT